MVPNKDMISLFHPYKKEWISGIEEQERRV
jgi:hypothetical protein